MGTATAPGMLSDAVYREYEQAYTREDIVVEFDGTARTLEDGTALAAGTGGKYKPAGVGDTVTGILVVSSGSGAELAADADLNAVGIVRGPAVCKRDGIVYDADRNDAQKDQAATDLAALTPPIIVRQDV